MKKHVAAAIVLALGVSANTASAGLLLAINNSTDHLNSIDTDTLVITDIGALGTNVNFGGLAYDANNNTVYLAGGRGNNNLYTVDTVTGAASLVGSHGVNDLFGLAFDTTNKQG